MNRRILSGLGIVLSLLPVQSARAAEVKELTVSTDYVLNAPLDGSATTGHGAQVSLNGKIQKGSVKMAFGFAGDRVVGSTAIQQRFLMDDSNSLTVGYRFADVSPQTLLSGIELGALRTVGETGDPDQDIFSSESKGYVGYIQDQGTLAGGLGVTMIQELKANLGPVTLCAGLEGGIGVFMSRKADEKTGTPALEQDGGGDFGAAKLCAKYRAEVLGQKLEVKAEARVEGKALKFIPVNADGSRGSERIDVKPSSAQLYLGAGMAF